MRANELRIRNWINSQFGGIQQVVDVMCDGVNTLKYEGINYEFIYPIPLTEKWLLKFGFELVSYHNKEKQIFLFEFGLSKDRFTIESNNGDLSYFRYNGNYVSVKHVHQLQNLYFALTGEELTLKNEER